MICKKCEIEMVFDQGRVCACLPPKYIYRCPKCGNVQYSDKPGKIVIKR